MNITKMRYMVILVLVFSSYCLDDEEIIESLSKEAKKNLETLGSRCYEICPKFYDEPIMQLNCYNLWILIENLQLEVDISRSLHELRRIEEKYDYLSDKIVDYENAANLTILEKNCKGNKLYIRM